MNVDMRRYKPFETYVKRLLWQENNCVICNQIVCDLRRAIDQAIIGDGTISEENANRMGFIGNMDTCNMNDYQWQCGEIRL